MELLKPYEPELFEPGEYLGQTGPGYFSILAKPSGRAEQHSYEVQHLHTVIEGLNPDIDTWISQAQFNRPNRRTTNLLSIGLLFSDLDTYHVPNLVTRTPDEQAWLLVGYCNENGIPAPSIVLFSGRGLQAKWLLAEALGPDRLIEWNHVQLGLVHALDDFGSDRNARDASRVLRLDQTVNTKSGERCRVVYTHSGVEAVPVRYDFADMQALFPQSERQAKPGKEPDNSVPIGESTRLKQLNWFRLYDLRDLWKRRGGVPIGDREVTLFWELNFLLRAEPGRVQDIWKEAEVLAAEIGTDFYRPSDLSTLYRKAKETLAGQGVVFQGKRYPGLYTPRNTTLIDRLRITDDEMRALRTIISKDEKVRRRREKRRAEGMKERTVFGDVKPWELEGISRAWWYRTRYPEE